MVVSLERAVAILSHMGRRCAMVFAWSGSNFADSATVAAAAATTAIQYRRHPRRHTYGL